MTATLAPDCATTTQTKTVAVVDQARGHRDGVVLAVTRDQDLALAVEAGSVEDLADADLAPLGGLILQTSGPGIDMRACVARVRRVAHSCTIVVVVPWVDDRVRGALAAFGADAVLSIDASLAEVLDALHAGHAEPAPDRAGDSASRAQAIADALRVTVAEHEVLRRLSEGVPPQRIAHEQGRSVSTIRDHIKSLRAKLDCATATELVVTAYRRGMLPGLSSPIFDEAGR